MAFLVYSFKRPQLFGCFFLFVVVFSTNFLSNNKNNSINKNQTKNKFCTWLQNQLIMLQDGLLKTLIKKTNKLQHTYVVLKHFLQIKKTQMV